MASEYRRRGVITCFTRNQTGQLTEECIAHGILLATPAIFGVHIILTQGTSYVNIVISQGLQISSSTRCRYFV